MPNQGRISPTASPATRMFVSAARRYAALLPAADTPGDPPPLYEADLVPLLRRVAEQAPPEAALASGARRRLADIGAVGHAIASSGTLARALSIALAHGEEIDVLLRLRYVVRGDRWIVSFPAAPGLPPAVARFVAEEWAASFFAFMAETTGIDRPEAEIDFAHAAHAGVDYARWLPATPRFRRPVNRLRLPAALLASEVISRDDEVLDLILRHLATRPAPERAIAARLRRHLMLHDRSARTIASAADALGLSTRTLARRLAEEGTSFSRILDDSRRDHALALARDPRLGAKQIADAIGFRNHESLKRAFLTWTGMPLGRWRRTQAGG